VLWNRIIIYADPDSTYHPDADPDPDLIFQIKAQTLKKVLKKAHIPYILACHLQIDADPVPDPAYHFYADTDPDFYLSRIRIHITVTKLQYLLTDGGERGRV
jgi:hypothetical protein